MFSSIYSSVQRTDLLDTWVPVAACMRPPGTTCRRSSRRRSPPTAPPACSGVCRSTCRTRCCTTPATVRALAGLDPIVRRSRGLGGVLRRTTHSRLVDWGARLGMACPRSGSGSRRRSWYIEQWFANMGALTPTRNGRLAPATRGCSTMPSRVPTLLTYAAVKLINDGAGGLNVGDHAGGADEGSSRRCSPEPAAMAIGSVGRARTRCSTRWPQGSRRGSGPTTSASAGCRVRCPHRPRLVGGAALYVASAKRTIESRRGRMGLRQFMVSPDRAMFAHRGPAMSVRSEALADRAGAVGVPARRSR